MMDENEGVILGRLKAGDPSAFDHLVNDHRPAMLRLATAITGDSETGEDVVQETLLKFYRSAAGFNGRGRLSTYLYRMTVNSSIDHLRAVRRRRRLSEGLLNFRNDSADDVVDAVENRETVSYTLARLPFKFRTPLLLAEVVELSYDEIAGILKIPVNTVRSRIFRAREKLVKIYETLGDR